jgi:hypothetical protein
VRRRKRRPCRRHRLSVRRPVSSQQARQSAVGDGAPGAADEAGRVGHRPLAARWSRLPYRQTRQRPARRCGRPGIEAWMGRRLFTGASQHRVLPGPSTLQCPASCQNAQALVIRMVIDVGRAGGSTSCVPWHETLPMPDRAPSRCTSNVVRWHRIVGPVHLISGMVYRFVDSATCPSRCRSESRRRCGRSRDPFQGFVDDAALDCRSVRRNCPDVPSDLRSA